MAAPGQKNDCHGGTKQGERGELGQGDLTVKCNNDL